MAASYTGAQLRARDLKVMESHRAELANKDLRYNRLKQNNEKTMHEQHAELARAQTFAQLLGFRDLRDGLATVDLAVAEYGTESVTYKATCERAERLQVQVDALKSEKEELDVQKQLMTTEAERCVPFFFFLRLRADIYLDYKQNSTSCARDSRSSEPRKSALQPSSKIGSRSGVTSGSICSTTISQNLLPWL